MGSWIQLSSAVVPSMSLQQAVSRAAAPPLPARWVVLPSCLQKLVEVQENTEKLVHRHHDVLKSGLRGVVGKAPDRFTGLGVELVVFVLLYLLSSQSWQFLQALFNREKYCITPQNAQLLRRL